MNRLLVISLIAALLSIGCGKERPPEQLTQLTLQLNWKPEPQFGGFYAAEVENIYKKHGLDVTITAGGAGAPTVEMVGAGTVPFAIVSADEIVRARAKGNPVVALFAVYQTNPQCIMTPAARGLKSLAEVFARPGTLAMERGLPYSDFLEEKYGFQNLKIVPSPFGDLTLYRSSTTYAMQCFITSEPLAAKRIGVEARAFLIAESGYNPYTTVLAAGESYVKANPQIVQSLVEAVREGWEKYLEDPSKANEHMGKLNPTMDAQTFKAGAEAQKALIQSADTEKFGLGAMTLERWQTLVEQLAALKVIERPVAAESCFVEAKRVS